MGQVICQSCFTNSTLVVKNRYCLHASALNLSLRAASLKVAVFILNIINKFRFQPYVFSPRHTPLSFFGHFVLMESRCIESTRTCRHRMKIAFLVALLQVRLAGLLVPGLRVAVSAALLQPIVAASLLVPVSIAWWLLGSFAPCS